MRHLDTERGTDPGSRVGGSKSWEEGRESLFQTVTFKTCIEKSRQTTRRKDGGMENVQGKGTELPANDRWRQTLLK